MGELLNRWELATAKTLLARRRLVVLTLCVVSLGTAGSVKAQVPLTPGYEVDENGIFNDGSSLSIDGPWLAFPLRTDDDLGVSAGAVQMYRRTATGWEQRQKLVASDAQERDFFGASVSIDGNRMFVGANGDDDAGVDAGAAYLFELEGGAWVEKQKFLPCQGDCPNQGNDSGGEVLVSGDWAFIASSRDSGLGVQAGAIDVRRRSGNQWPVVQRLDGAGLNSSPSFLSAEMAVSGDWLAASAPTDDIGALDAAGSIYLWQRVGNQWQERQRIMHSQRSDGDLAGRTGLAMDGNWLMFGYEDDDGCDGTEPGLTGPEFCESGAVAVFQRQGGTWVQTQKLRPADNGFADRFGYTVAMEGNRAVIGAFGSDELCPHDAVLEFGLLNCDPGAAYLYERQGNTWVEVETIIPCGAAEGARFGFATDLDQGRLAVLASGFLFDTVPYQPTVFVYDVESFCSPDANTLCLNNCRFKVEAEWTDFNLNEGVGSVVPFGSDDSGMLTFFEPDNWEVLIKILDGCVFTNHFWVFAAATTSVEYKLTVTDMATGVRREYANPLGTRADAITDSFAFPTCDDFGPGFGPPADPPVHLSTQLDELEKSFAPTPVPAPSDIEKGGCSEGSENLCLNSDRFRVTATWRDFGGNEGTGKVVEFGSDDSGLFYFFEADNWEMLVKVLDGCAINDRLWVFAAATTNIEYSLTVTDTQTNQVREYVNPLGVASPALTDTMAFATCPAR